MEGRNISGHDAAIWTPLSSTSVYSCGRCLAMAMEHRGVSWLDHYIDDFFTVGDPGLQGCAINMGIMKGVFAEANIPTEPEKDVGPATVIGMLGIELDTDESEIRLPLEKLEGLKTALESWRGRRACKKRELLSLIGSP